MNRYYISIGLLFFVTSCAKFDYQPLVSTTSLDSIENRSLSSFELKEYIEGILGEIENWPKNNWDLQYLILAAYYFHPDLDVARAKYSIADARIITAGMRPNPTFSVSPKYDFNMGSASGNTSPWLIDASISIPIETANKRGYRIAQAKNLSESAYHDIMSVAWSVRGRVKSALTNLYSSQEKMILLQEQMNKRKELIKLKEKRLSIGEISLSDLVLERIALNQTNLLFQDAKLLYEDALIALASSLGLTANALRDIQIDFQIEEEGLSKFNDTILKTLRYQALTNRADLLSSLAVYKASQSALQLEIAKQYPDINIGPGYNFEFGDAAWGIVFSAIMPIFNQNEGPIAEARARREAAAAQFLALQTKVLGEIDSAIVNYQNSLQKQAVAISLLHEEQDKMLRAEAMFHAGEEDLINFTNIQLEYSATRLGFFESNMQLQQALNTLESSIQVSLNFSEDEVLCPLDFAIPKNNSGIKKGDRP